MFSAGYTHKNTLPKRAVSSRTISEYSPFGVLLPERAVNAGDFRYGFQGQEKDDEIKGEGNSYDLGERMYDPRLGRFFTTDPYMNSFAFQSPYIYAGNSPIMNIDFMGLEKIPVTFTMTNSRGRVKTVTVTLDREDAQTIEVKVQGALFKRTYSLKSLNSARGSSLEIMKKNSMDEIDRSTDDSENILNKSYHGLSLVDILSGVLAQKPTMCLTIIGNDAITGEGKWSIYSESYFAPQGKRWNSAASESGSFFAAVLNPRGNPTGEYVIVHMDGTIETFSNSTDADVRWNELRSQYALTRAETVRGEFDPTLTNINTVSRYSIEPFGPIPDYNGSGVSLFSANDDAVGITMFLDFSKEPVYNPGLRTSNPNAIDSTKDPDGD